MIRLEISSCLFKQVWNRLCCYPFLTISYHPLSRSLKCWNQRLSKRKKWNCVSVIAWCSRKLAQYQRFTLVHSIAWATHPTRQARMQLPTYWIGLTRHCAKKLRHSSIFVSSIRKTLFVQSGSRHRSIIAFTSGTKPPTRALI